MTFFAKFTTPARKTQDYFRPNPARDWFTMLVVFFVTLLGLIGWSIWIFDAAAKGDVLGGSTATSSLPVDNNSFTEIHKIFEDRADEAYKNELGVYNYIDPFN